MGAGDCFTRSVAIATQLPYIEVYKFVNAVAKDMKTIDQAYLQKKSRFRGSLGNARQGVKNPLFHEVMRRMGWKWNPTMRYGQGCRVHLRRSELPLGRLICRVSKHMVAFIDGVIRDTYDPSRCGTRCVYGYFVKCPASAHHPVLETRPLSLLRPLDVPALDDPHSADFNVNVSGQTQTCIAKLSSHPQPVLQVAVSHASTMLGASDDDSDDEVRRRHRRKQLRRRT